MCKELARLYLAKEDARAVATRSGLDVVDITITDRSLETWRNIIIYAIDHGQLSALVETCLKEHTNSPVLLEALNLFYKKETEPADEDETASASQQELLAELLEVLDASYTGFKAQINNRNQLYERVRNRLSITESFQYETFFATYFDEMNAFEKRLHKVIRTYTDYIREHNLKAREIALQLKHLDPSISKFPALRRHLSFWLNKYDTLFLHDPAMCLVYTGVEDRVPFPKGVEEQIRTCLENLPKNQRSQK